MCSAIQPNSESLQSSKNTVTYTKSSPCGPSTVSRLSSISVLRILSIPYLRACMHELIPPI